MRIARFAFEGVVGYGVVEGDPTGPLEALEIAIIKNHPFGEIELTDQRLPLPAVRLLSPVLPSKMRPFMSLLTLTKKSPLGENLTHCQGLCATV